MVVMSDRKWDDPVRVVKRHARIPVDDAHLFAAIEEPQRECVLLGGFADVWPN